MRRFVLLLLLCGCDCGQHLQHPFAWPKSAEDARARLLQHIPEGRDIEGAREFMAEHGFACDPPLPSAADAHAIVCHALPTDGGWARWTVELIERKGRLADVSAR